MAITNFHCRDSYLYDDRLRYVTVTNNYYYKSVESRYFQLKKFIKESELILLKHPHRRQLKLDVMKAQKELLGLENER